MKISTFLIFFTIIQVSAENIFTQDALVSINVKEVRVFDLLTEIEEQTDYLFFFSPKEMDMNRKISVEAKEKKVSEILTAVFDGTDIQFTVVKDHIVLMKKADNIQWTAIPKNDSNQIQKVTGKVTDASTGEPLIGVNILIQNTNTGAITDMNGRYSIELPSPNSILIFSYVGFISETIGTDKRNVIDVALIPDIQKLEQVVVIGYGTMSMKDISGSVINVSEKDFNKGVTRDVSDLLAGRVSGLVITSGSGDVTSSSTMRLRGTSSLTGNSEPFVVVDGIPGMSISSIAPQDIESISVLKDASAAAIYGSRSASGVILITTKKGKKDKLHVEYEGYAALDNVTNIPDLLDAETWRQYVEENNINVEGIDMGANTNWFDEIMRTGFTQNHSLSLSGTGENNQFRGTVSYLDQDGVVKDNFMERFNTRLAFSQKALHDKLDIALTGVITERNYSPSDPRNFILASNMIPVVPVKNEDGTWFESYEYDQGNPVHNIAFNSHLHKNNLYYGNLKCELQITRDITAGINLLKQRETDDFGEYYSKETERGRNDQGFAKRESWTRDKKVLETTLNFKKNIGAHSLNILLGYSYEDNHYQNSGAQNRNFATDLSGYNNIGTGQNLQTGDVWSSANMSKLISFFGRINYRLKEKYLLSASVRRDGSSKFGTNHKWGTFPSVSAAWRLNEEAFLKNADFLEDLKLRIGYGVSGNQDNLEPYQSLQLYGAKGVYYDDGEWLQAYGVTQNVNKNLKWEETAMFNVGIEYSLFKSRVNGSVEYYDKNTKDLLYTYPVATPPYFVSTIYANVGSISNKGIEVLINTDIIRKDNFNWNMSMNFAHNNNKITKLSNNEFQTSSVKTGRVFIRGGSENTSHIIEEGKPLGTFYGWVCLGLDEDGKYIMNDSIDGVSGLSQADRTYIGSAQPKLTYGISNSFNYKNFDLSFFLRGVYGNDVLNFSRMAYATSQWLPGANVLKEGITNGLNDNPKYSSYYIEKGSFLRLDNASLAYNFNTKGIIGVEKLRVYITGQNLFIITKYKGLDPEVDMSGLAPGVEGREYYPKSRTLSLGINLAF